MYIQIHIIRKIGSYAIKINICSFVAMYHFWIVGNLFLFKTLTVNIVSKSVIKAFIIYKIPKKSCLNFRKFRELLKKFSAC